MIFQHGDTLQVPETPTGKGLEMDENPKVKKGSSPKINFSNFFKSLKLLHHFKIINYVHNLFCSKMNATSFDSSDDEADLKRRAPDSPPEERAGKKPKNEEIDTNNELDFEDTMSDTSATLMDTPYYNADECEFIPRYAICCLNCKCSEDKIMRTFGPNLGCKVLNNCGNSIVENGNHYLYHKACCHNFRIGCQKKYESPMQQAILNSHTCEQKLEEAKPLSDLQRMYNSERRKEVQRHNEDFRDVLNQWNWKIETYPDYVSRTKLG